MLGIQLNHNQAAAKFLSKKLQFFQFQTVLVELRQVPCRMEQSPFAEWQKASQNLKQIYTELSAHR